jgi:hypothetical protein
MSTATPKPKVKNINVELIVRLTHTKTYEELDEKNYSKEVEAWINSELRKGRRYGDYVDCIKGPVRIYPSSTMGGLRARYSFLMDGKCHHFMDGNRSRDTMIAESALQTTGDPIITIGGTQYLINIGSLSHSKPTKADIEIQRAQKKQKSDAAKAQKKQAAEALRKAKKQAAEALRKAKKQAAEALRKAKKQAAAAAKPQRKKKTA